MKKSIGFLKYALKMVLVKGEWFDLYLARIKLPHKIYHGDRIMSDNMLQMSTWNHSLSYFNEKAIGFLKDV